MLDDRKARGAPIAYKIYPAGHIWDWPELQTLNWPDVAYDPDVTEQCAKDGFEFLDKALKQPCAIDNPPPRGGKVAPDFGTGAP